MKIIALFIVACTLSSCWPSSISFVDGSLPDEWKSFSVKTLNNNAPNAPLSYPAELTEDVKDGISNRTRLLLKDSKEETDVEIEGTITRYTLAPIALQNGDNAAQNRLSITVKFNIFTHLPEEDEMQLTSTRFIDYDVTTDFSTIEANLLEEINEQIVQDVINKLLSNW